MKLVEWLIRTDKQCFIFIQTHLTGPSTDQVMLVIRNPLTWVPVYIFMLYWILKNDRKQALQFILLTAITVGITDFTASQWLKPLFGRLRPCYDPETIPYLRGLISCGGQFSFPSNHATNHFALASFWFFTIRDIKGKKWYWVWAWALLICMGQVYVGKHFPLDILGGALYGTTTGLGGVWLFRNWTAVLSKMAGLLGIKKSSARTSCKGLQPGQLQPGQLQSGQLGPDQR